MPNLLHPVIAIPARNEADRLPRLLRALDHQDYASAATPLQLVLVLNNTTDGSAAVVAELTPSLKRLSVKIVEVAFEPKDAHVGSARRLAMELAASLVGAEGVILTTDADGAPSPDWVSKNLAAIDRGADIVGGRIIGDQAEEAALGAGFQTRAAKYARYAALSDELASLVDPIEHDPWPRHQDHTGGSIAVRADVYRAVGGLPALPFREDIAFVEAVVRAGYRLVHPQDVTVTVSARTVGRAPGGMADCVRTWVEDENAGKPILVEAPADILARLHRRSTIRHRPDLAQGERLRLLELETGLDALGTIQIEAATEILRSMILELTEQRNAA
ncbi:glycosyltransferase [Devosia aurantiaca]|uniref:Glycosyltransferase n=1 Tax=Devosia aurantiaca TaxID=2714858 RepID=A0A6M1SP01_9HYPH|nr:glycosyltransferase [Devosia aurantiaca]NGP18404.1 glycosyltransferase [Devosia aurantiaca]